MSDLSIKELEKFSNKILEDYDNKIPGSIFKEKIRITNENALLIQSHVAKLRQKRGEEVIGYKIGCVSKDTQKKWVLISRHVGIFGKVNYLKVEQY